MAEAIKKQLERDRVEIKYNPSNYINKKKKKKEIDLNSIQVIQYDTGRQTYYDTNFRFFNEETRNPQ